MGTVEDTRKITWNVPYIGLRVSRACSLDTNAILSKSRELKFEYVCCPIKQDVVIKNLLGLKDWEENICRLPPLRIKDICAPKELVIVLPDLAHCFLPGTRELVRKNAEKILRLQIQSGFEREVAGLILPISEGTTLELLLVLFGFIFPIIDAGRTVLWVELPIVASKSFDPWHFWTEIKRLCNSSQKVGFFLKIPQLPPTFSLDERIIQRWIGAGVKAVSLKSGQFHSINGYANVVLSKELRKVVKSLIHSDVNLMVSADKVSSSLDEHRIYLNKLRTEVDTEKLRKSFAHYPNDTLMFPLEPVRENLDDATYKEFEKDRVKYELYETAVTRALSDVAQKQPKDVDIQIVVAGAGMRGPLVDATLNAMDKLGIQDRVIILAVDRNPDTFTTLTESNQKKWSDRVKVVLADMRTWMPDCKADLIVSELIGSFADNELSPECLTGAQRFLKDDGIVIPQRYSNFLEPVMCEEAWKLVRKNSNSSPENWEEAYNTMYIAYLKGIFSISDPQELIIYKHPDQQNYEEVFVEKEFTAGNLATCLHGFLGYFSAVLYDQVAPMSILPESHTPGMFSWYPAFLPLKDPIEVEPYGKIRLKFWRKQDESKVWYEWCAYDPISTDGPSYVHNLNGRFSSFFK